MYLKLDIIQTRGYSPWKVVRGCAVLKTHFSRSLSSSLRPPFQAISACFSSLRPPFQQKSQFFTNFAVLEPKFSKNSVPNPQILQNFSSKASMILAQNSVPYKHLFFPKNQFFQPLFFVNGRSLSPHLRSKFRGGGGTCIWSWISSLLKNHMIRVVFQYQAMYAHTSFNFRGAKNVQNWGKKCVFLVILTNLERTWRRMQKRVSRVYFHTWKICV